MLIQNISSSTTAQSTPSGKSASAGEFDRLINAQSSTQSIPASPVELPAVAVTQVAKVASVKPNAEQLQNIINSINKELSQSDRNLSFSIDSSTKKSVIKLTDTKTGDIIRQFPSEEALSISRSIDHIQGLLLKQKA